MKKYSIELGNCYCQQFQMFTKKYKIYLRYQHNFSCTTKIVTANLLVRFTEGYNYTVIMLVKEPVRRKENLQIGRLFKFIIYFI